METKIYMDYKRSFNLGYEITKELNLKNPLFKGQDTSQASINAMKAGILQYVQEVRLSRNINNPVSKKVLKSNLKKKSRNKNSGRDFSL